MCAEYAAAEAEDPAPVPVDVTVSSPRGLLPVGKSTPELRRRFPDIFPAKVYVRWEMVRTVRAAVGGGGGRGRAAEEEQGEIEVRTAEVKRSSCCEKKKNVS